ncbi:MAG: acetate kinase [Oscillospiraceae bacterium]|nr:acetate kinase [Oscillospiraceae bacterium]
MKVLVINAGSSSLKYQVFNMETEEIIAVGLCDRIGIDGHLKHTPMSNGKEVFNEPVNLPSHAEAISAVIEKLTSEEYGVVDSLDEIKAVGHRVVHGGKKFTESILINDEVLKAITECTTLAPLHIPANLMGINACIDAIPGVPQVAVFDTAFHSTIPQQAYIYPIPYKYYEANDIRRYGFHGTSHRYISEKTIEYLGKGAAGTRIVTCHLGNGASLAAIKDGKSIDTSLGVTPLEGIPMGTRSGSIDPAIVEIIANIEGISTADAVTILNKESGVLGISGVSSDFRDISTAAGINSSDGSVIEGVTPNERAKLALEVYAYNVAKFIGSYFTILGGLDALVFTAGVGENSPPMRAMICNYLQCLGIEIDENVNIFRNNGEIVDITSPNTTIKVLVVPTNEELVIARDTVAIVQ